MADHINFVKCLQGDTACPGACFHKYLFLRLVINILDRNIDMPNLQPGHFDNGTCHCLLDGSADFADIRIAFQDQVQVHDYIIIFNHHSDSFKSASEKAVHASLDRCHALDPLNLEC